MDNDSDNPMGEDSAAKSPADGKIRPQIKIKLPTKKAEEEVSSAVVKSHYCKECDRSFNSGKALGGHMSSAHVQANKDYVSKRMSSKRKLSGSYSGSNITCGECNKVFHSEKSLFGHMRLHPERPWRGIHPPPKKIERPSSSSSSSDDEDDTDHRIKEDKYSDVGFNLTSWPTSKRGRGPVTSTQAVTDSGSQNKGDGSETFVAGLKLVKLLNYRDSTRVQENGPSPKLDLELGNGKGKEKLPENTDAESESSDDILRGAIQVLVSGKQGNINNINIGNHRCKECGMIFPTHQALGGHRSSHNKFKITIVNTIERDSVNSEVQLKKTTKKKNINVKAAGSNDDDGGGSVAFTFDLNMAPAEEEEEEEEEEEDEEEEDESSLTKSSR